MVGKPDVTGGMVGLGDLYAGDRGALPHANHGSSHAFRIA
jgi:hypothetical protein